jgi:hypothetical protein
MSSSSLKQPCWPRNKRPPPAAEGATPCRIDELEPGDFVKVGGLLKEVKLVVGGVDVKTTDGQYYGARNLQGFLKRRRPC